MGDKITKQEVAQSLNMLGFMTGKMTIEEYQAAIPKERVKPQYTESQEQIAFVKWCMMSGYPYNLIFAIENEGKKTLQAGAIAKTMGKRSGVSDLFLPHKSIEYSGLFIEMKSAKGRLSDSQKRFIEIVTKQGYKCEVCYSSEQAITAIKRYVKGEQQ